MNFLNAVLKNDEKALIFIENHPTDDGVANNLITQNTKKPVGDAFTFQDFNDLASSQNYEKLFQLYKSVIKDRPSFKIPEGNLNTLGLLLVFNSDKPQQGINVFLLATKLYSNSANLFDSLAEGYLFIGNKEKAIESFTESLKFNSRNQNAINRLEQLRN